MGEEGWDKNEGKGQREIREIREMKRKVKREVTGQREVKCEGL